MADSHLASVPDAPPGPKQPTLEFGGRPNVRKQDVALASIRISGFGTPPDAGFIESVAEFGVMKDVLLRQDGEHYEVRDGRRRVLAAIEAGLDKVPARVLTSGDPSLVDPALTIVLNAHASPNPVVEFRAIEDLQLRARKEGQGLGPSDVARELHMPLKTVRARLRLSRLSADLRDAWEAGKFGTKVGEAAAGLDEHQQAELVRRCEAAGTITMDDVQEVKRIGVQSHQRTLPGDRWAKRIREHTDKALDTALKELGSDSKVVSALRDALKALEAEAAEELRA